LRVGVLPFMVPPTTLVEESLALSLSLEIASALARFRWFDVIAPVALMHRPDPAHLTDDLLSRNRLDYVVDGALSVIGGKYQISVRLLDLREYASPVWNDRFELAVDEFHRLEEVTAKIVGRIDPVILFIEAREPRDEKHSATGRLMRAIPLFWSMEREKYEKAGELIQEALALEPENAMVSAWAACWHLFHIGQGWATDEERESAAMQKYAREAVRQDPNNAEALGIYAHICAFHDKDFETAVANYDRAFRLNPNLAFIWALSSTVYSYLGEPQKALQHLQRYRELSPFDPYFAWVETLYTIAYFFAGEYEQAATVGRRAVKATPDFSNGYTPLIAALGHLGRIEEAAPYVKKLLELKPKFTVQWFGRNYPIKKSADRERYMEGLRKAGVPEGV
jgi:tetratricopeptide (TPR) repeat protein